MKILLLALLVLVLLGMFLWFLRLGGCVIYSENGVLVRIRIGPLYLTVFPRKKEPKKMPGKKRAGKKKSKKQKSGTTKKKSKKAEQKPKRSIADRILGRPAPGEGDDSGRGGDLQLLMDALPDLFELLGEAVRKLRVEELTLHYTIAGRNDPACAAVQYGAVFATGGALGALLNQHLTVKKQSVGAVADFTSTETKVYVCLNLSYTLGQLVVIGIHALKKLLKLRKNVE